MKQQAMQIASNIVHVTLMQSAHAYESWLAMQVAANTLHKKTLTLKTWNKKQSKEQGTRKLRWRKQVHKITLKLRV